MFATNTSGPAAEMASGWSIPDSEAGITLTSAPVDGVELGNRPEMGGAVGG